MQLTPQKVVEVLDKYIVGQEEAKKAVAIALCNRERRRLLPPELQQEVIPKNILMIGPTGVGKTEIARRIARFIQAPFTKVEATKFTEVGYVGRDVESIVYELAEVSVLRVYEGKLREVEAKAEKVAVQRLVDYLYRQLPKEAGPAGQLSLLPPAWKQSKRLAKRHPSRQSISKLILNNQLEEEVVEIEVAGAVMSTLSEHRPQVEDYWEEEDPPYKGYEDKKQWRKMPVREARRVLAREEASKLVSFQGVVDEALDEVQSRGIVFIDEIDKLCAPRIEVGRDVSGEGVQRDMLPLVEGTTVLTRYGPVKTDHILF
ncbi:MAG: AAA family ATPase, partial [Chloroflexota bacterium]